MKIDDPHFGLIRGKIGGLIYYVVDGQQYVRRVAIPGKKRKVEITGVHPKHEGAMARFAYIQAYCSFFKKYVSATIWKTAGQAEHCRSNNLFHRINGHCFSDDSKLVDLTTFRFSFGVLQLPRNMAIEREGDLFRVTWEEEREGTLVAATDCLCVGVIYDDRPGAPLWAQEVTGRRGDRQGTFRLTAKQDRIAHVYCFFGREDETAYSESLHFKLV